MSSRSGFAATVALSLFLTAVPTPSSQPPGTGAPDPALRLTGVWQATRRLGPELRGPLSLTRHGASWSGRIGAFESRATVDEEGRLGLEFPADLGTFQATYDAQADVLRGHWIQPGIAFLGNRFASPVELREIDAGRWRGDVVPLDDRVTMYLVVRPQEDGTAGGFIRNPEFNLGAFMTIHRIELDEDAVRLSGHYRWSPDEEQTLAGGRLHENGKQLSLHFPMPSPAGSYDFARIDDDAGSGFPPRSAGSARYVYRSPPAGDDGWATASLDDVGISREKIEAFVRMLIDQPTNSVDSPDIHGLLIARHGKLVLEEYFHGYHRDRPHETRSASKSLASVLVGAAAHAGTAIDEGTSVYDALYDGNPPDDLDPRKRRMTVGHLLTATSGLACDDWDGSSPGGEDTMQTQTEQPDWHRFTADLPMVAEPGERAAYCSGGINLVGRVLEKTSGLSLPALFRERIAEPLEIDRYYLNLTPTGHAYLGGGIRWLPRDFMKLGQLVLDRGTWNGRRVMDAAWARKIVTPRFDLGNEGRYAYAWWVRTYPFHGREVEAFFAGGNGGQIVMGFPELDLAVAFYGGNYNSATLFTAQRRYVPEFILPAIEERP